MSHRTLIKGGRILSMDSAVGDFEEGDLLIEGEQISEVEHTVDAADADIIDAQDMIVIPGFVDTHRHTWQSAMRNLQPDADLEAYIVSVCEPIALAFRPEDAYAGTLIGALAALDSGITTMLDWCHIVMGPEFSDAAIAALRDAGIRAVFAHGTPPQDEWNNDTSPPHSDDIKRLRGEYFSTDDQLMTLAAALRGPEFASLEVSEKDWLLAREVGARISVHVGVAEYGGRNAIEGLHERGLLGDDTTYIHCCTVSDAALKLVAETGGTVSVAAPVEMQMGHGRPPISRLMELGIRPGLSVDVETSVPTDMFTQMRGVIHAQRGFMYDDAYREGRDPGDRLSARDVLEFATIEGARVNGLERRTGSLTPGKQADVVLLRSDHLNVWPVSNAVGAVVEGADTRNVDTVFVAGKCVKRAGQLVRTDLEKIKSDVLASLEHLHAEVPQFVPKPRALRPGRPQTAVS